MGVSQLAPGTYMPAVAFPATGVAPRQPLEAGFPVVLTHQNGDLPPSALSVDNSYNYLASNSNALWHHNR
jgi:hypothetical protein